MKNDKLIQGIEFYDLMQAYRIADPTDQNRVCKKFDDVKNWINEMFVKQNNEMFDALKESGRLISCGKCESGLKVIESTLKDLRLRQKGGCDDPPFISQLPKL